MSDDIVGRLRHQATWLENRWPMTTAGRLDREAAIEIEQLRADKKRLQTSEAKIEKSLLEHMTRASCNCGMDSGCQLAVRMLKALAEIAANKECEE